MIAISDLQFAYNKRKRLFEDLNLHLVEGRIYGLLGKNGNYILLKMESVYNQWAIDAFQRFVSAIFRNKKSTIMKRSGKLLIGMIIILTGFLLCQAIVSDGVIKQEKEKIENQK